MKAKNLKIIKVIIIAVFVITIFTVHVQAATPMTIDQMLTYANQFAHGGNKQVNEKEFQEVVIPIGQKLVHIASWVLVIVTVVIGIKYVLADPKEKATLKGQLYGLVVATVIVYGGQALWAALVKTFE